MVSTGRGGNNNGRGHLQVGNGSHQGSHVSYWGSDNAGRDVAQLAREISQIDYRAHC